ncbi:SAM-dependent methyltransferase [Emticicia sp. CRIBPO]|uniref:O-methyltransferase n=1 Tax=Emticicia sp. CRIBPO TaxID=2683258 RepID=UPI001412AC35|nr:class I SAM-dependent methyltransferase [Emticicia sp. CRIBPO]NBA87588.1 SAM-dependent methyltransferase [Emticicia sp. CRIBPO]
MLSDFFRYLYRATNHHGIHSPFVYDFYNSVVRSKVKPDVSQQIEHLRKSLKKDDRMINIVDFGAGSKKDGKKQRKVSDIIKSAEKAPKWGILLHYIIKKFGYRQIIDLGTSFGITTAYQAVADPAARVISFEGCPETADIAKENFKKLNLSNIELITGNIDETLTARVSEMPVADMVFFDANHRYEPTLRYFEICLARKNENSCFVFDDIYWSDEMKAAWEQIKQHEEVTVTIDLFFVGLVFFRKGQAREHFILRYF